MTTRCAWSGPTDLGLYISKHHRLTMNVNLILKIEARHRCCKHTTTWWCRIWWYCDRVIGSKYKRLENKLILYSQSMQYCFSVCAVCWSLSVVWLRLTWSILMAGVWYHAYFIIIQKNKVHRRLRKWWWWNVVFIWYVAPKDVNIHLHEQYLERFLNSTKYILLQPPYGIQCILSRGF